jgi:hypothetical protein
MAKLRIEIALIECNAEAVAAMRKNGVLKLRLLPVTASDYAAAKALASHQWSKDILATEPYLQCDVQHSGDLHPQYNVHLFGNGFSDVLLTVDVDRWFMPPDQPPLKREGLQRFAEPQKPAPVALYSRS